MTRFDLDINVRMEPSEHGRWVRHEDVPKRQPLTEEQMWEIYRKVTLESLHNSLIRFALAIEAAHGIKGEA